MIEIHPFLVDPFGKKDKQFAIAGWNDTDAQSATTFLISPGFKAKEHPHECLNFYYYIQVYAIRHFRKNVSSPHTTLNLSLNSL